MATRMGWLRQRIERRRQKGRAATRMDGRKSIYCGEIPARMRRYTLFVAVVQTLDVQRFVENRIDLSVLPDLTEQDLEKLGVLLGGRRKMLRAIRDLGNAP
jgi:hypothetical protein